MGKAKGASGVQNKHIYTRASYLYQAATLLTSHTQTTDLEVTKQDDPSEHVKARLLRAETEEEIRALSNLSRQLLHDMRAMSLKVQMRLTPELKRTLCRYCDTLQVEGLTCTSWVENKSKHGKKPWADVLVLGCSTCGHRKRYPVNASRQKRRALRDLSSRTARVQITNNHDNDIEMT